METQLKIGKVYEWIGQIDPGTQYLIVSDDGVYVRGKLIKSNYRQYKQNIGNIYVVNSESSSWKEVKTLKDIIKLYE